MVWIAVSGSSLLGAIEIAARKFDRWGIRDDDQERVLFCSPEALEELRGDVQRRRSLLQRMRHTSEMDTREWLGEHCGISRVVVSSLFGQPLLRHEAPGPTPAAEATIMGRR